MNAFLSISITVFLLGVHSLLWAQEQEIQSTETVPPQEAVESAKAPSDPSIEKIEVTGSLIKRIDVEGPSPMVVIDREEIEKTGYSEIGEILRVSTASPFGGDGATADLKGIGSSRTLVLLNGERLPSKGDFYGNNNTQVNIIPLAIVERIEILKDGASATYGSDALAGVVNIITRKDFDGSAFISKLDVSAPSGGEALRASYAYGKHRSDGHFLSSFQFRHNTPHRASDRSYLQDLNKEFYFSNPGNFQTSSGLFPVPGCTPLNSQGYCEQATADKALYNKFNLGISSVTDYEKKLAGGKKFKTLFYLDHEWTHSEQFGDVFVDPVNGIGIKFTGAQAPASWTTDLGSNYSGGDITIYGRLDDIGLVKSFDEQTGLGLILSLEDEIGTTSWEWKLINNTQRFAEKSVSKNRIKYNEFRTAVINGTYNPFGSARDSSTFVGTYENQGEYNVNRTTLNFSGELGDSFGATWSSAVGFQAGYEEYKIDVDDNTANNNFSIKGADGSANRNSYAAYVELHGLFANSLELQASGRFDHYNDFGNTVNPKVALRYNVFNGLMLRGSYATGFKSPKLTEAYASSFGAYFFTVDRKRCNETGAADACRSRAYQGAVASNPNLKEEESQTWNIGAVMQPTKYASIGVDFWVVDIKNVIGLNTRKLLEAEALNPSAYSNIVQRDSVTDEIKYLNMQYLNTGRRFVKGLDTSWQYRRPVFGGTFQFKYEQTFMLEFLQSIYPELGEENILGENGTPHWRHNITVGFDKKKWGFLATFRTVNRQEKSDKEQGHISQRTELDASAFYQNSIAKWTLGVRNILGTTPQLDDSISSRVDRSIYQAFATYFLLVESTF